MLKMVGLVMHAKSHRNLVSWNTTIAGYVHNNEVERAYGLFVRMPERDLFSWTLMITCCTRNGELERARGLFNLLPDKRDAACWNAMSAGYAKKGRSDEMRAKNLVS
ncbi:putative pentatricopeptide [Rosa chinensis]|uniref:Putative pentatricopeptide n=1 Tax=Rosa chinensis TaxID=74649 RepID=A0A2P6S0S5_ROSCH|nr:putative pentatricopeptide [Rosa chinensis]